MLFTRIGYNFQRRFSTTPSSGLKFFGYELSESSMMFLKALQLVGVLYCVKTYGVDFNTTWGASMSPLIREDGNIVLVDKITPRFTGWSKGDVVVAAVPSDGHLVMKRICGLPGESVPVDRLGKRHITVPPGSTWLLGDNRPASLDSRNYGAVPMALLQGRVAAVIWPPSDMRLITSGDVPS
jgi:inner membrane protease subunit 1